MWVESLLIVGDQIVDAAELDGWRLDVGACDLAAPRMLLAHLTVTEDQASVAAYTALTILALQGDPARRTGTIDLALQGDPARRTGTIDLAQPVLTLEEAEQQTLRDWLIARS